MNRRFVVILFVPLFICIAATLAYCFAHRQPAYEGKPLSKWLSELALDPAVSQKARRAIRAIGTNALPCLAVMIRASDSPPWKRVVVAFNSKQRFIRIAITPEDVIRSDAVEGYRVLGGLAKGNVPALIQLLESESSVRVRSSIAEALGAIGPEAKGAIPALAKAAKVKDLQLRWSATSALMNIQLWTDPNGRHPGGPGEFR